MSFQGDALTNLDVFFDQLDPYCTWYNEPTYGWDWRWCKGQDVFSTDLRSRFINANVKAYVTSSVPIVCCNKYKSYQWVAGPSEN